MKKAPDTLKTDVEDLVEKSTVAEAAERVWQRFDDALSRLDEDSLKMLRSYFNGSSVQTLSREWGLSETEVEAWISKKKRELVQHLRQEVQVRQ